MHKLFLYCDRATALMERGQEESLTLRERMQLSMHTAMCGICKNYERMSMGMERFFAHWSESVPDEERKMPAERKQKLVDELRAKQ